MNAFLTLLKREWLEARLAFLWFPLAALAAFIFMGLMMLAISGVGEVEVIIRSEGDAPNFFFPNQWSDQDWQARMAVFRNVFNRPFHLLYMIGALFVLLGSLYDERKDRSVLFWKSLPVTDLSTVLSKLVVPLWIAPLVVIACTLTAQIFALMVLSAHLSSTGLGDPWLLWQHAGLATEAFRLLLGFLIQGLWVLPVAGYLLLVSASVPGLTLLWALAVPVLAASLEYALFGTRLLGTGFARHLEPAALADFTGNRDRIMPAPHTVSDQLGLLLDPDLWLGVIIGAGLVYAAAWVRGRSNEL